MLTDQTIRNLISTGTVLKRSAGKGLHICALPDGRKLWCLAWSPRYARVTETRLRADILPVLGDLPAHSIMPRTVLEALRAVEARGSVEMAHRIKNYCSEIFRSGIPDGRCETDPCRDLTAAVMKPAPVRHRAKVAIKDLPAF